jgi:GTPase SAR1 family protein
MFYRNASVAILAYDISRMATLDAVRSFHGVLIGISPSVKVILIGLKLDLAALGERAVPFGAAEAFGASLEPPAFAVLEASSRSGEGIEELKEAIANALKEVTIEPEKGVELAPPGPKGSKKRCC